MIDKNDDNTIGYNYGIHGTNKYKHNHETTNTYKYNHNYDKQIWLQI